MKRAWQQAFVVLLLALQAAPAFACFLPDGMASSECCCPDTSLLGCNDSLNAPCEDAADAQDRCCTPVTPSTFALSRLTAGAITSPAVFDIDSSAVDAILPVSRPSLVLEPDAEQAHVLPRVEDVVSRATRPPYLLFERLTL